MPVADAHTQTNCYWQPLRKYISTFLACWIGNEILAIRNKILNLNLYISGSAYKYIALIILTLVYFTNARNFSRFSHYPVTIYLLIYWSSMISLHVQYASISFNSSYKIYSWYRYVMFWTEYTTIFIINDCNRTVWVSPRGIYGDTIIDSSCRKDSKNHICYTNIFL